MVMAVVFAIYELVGPILLLAVRVVDERVKPLSHVLGISNWGSANRKQEAIEETYHLGGSDMRRTKITAKGQVTIPADLRERFGIKKGTRISWERDGSRLILTPIPRLRKKP